MSKNLLNKDGEGPMELLKGDKLHQVMDKFTTLCSPNVKNLMASFKHLLIARGFIDNILILKSKSPYDYIQDSCFLGQLSRKKCSFQDVCGWK
jgi:hypothetical protein